ncbi:MAG: hypothetical protein JSS95_09335 [Acidobacteria bacterium]|nr:hypothetical protein [Acidobacteriota bacterium]
MKTRDDLTVALILTPSFDTLTNLIGNMPVWAVDVPEHRTSIPMPEKRAYQDWLTLYKTYSPSLEDECINQLGSIEEHFPDVSHILLIGLNRSQKLEDDLRNLGYDLEQDGVQLSARRRLD